MPSRPRKVARAVAHVTVIALIAFTALSGINALQSGAGASGLGLNVVPVARGAADLSAIRSAHFVLQPPTADNDPLLTHRVFPTATPTPTPRPQHSAAAAPTLAPQPAVRVLAVAGNGRLLWPVPGAVITQYFSAYHLAIDMATSAGSPVLAAAAGTVIWAGWRNNGGGLVVEIDHGNGMHTVYNHLGAILVSVGAVVSAGHRIASVGCTGNCTGPHVHFQVSINGVFVNPLRYL